MRTTLDFKPKGILFDLDGTIADTADDLCAAVNRMRLKRHRPPLDHSCLRPLVSFGSTKLLDRGLNIPVTHHDFPSYRQEFIAEYENQICAYTTLFDGMQETLAFLEKHDIAWGIVTNKPEGLTHQLLTYLPIRPTCVIGGDTCQRAKPHPDPLLLAASQLNLDPRTCLYVGDAEHDIQAANAAQMQGVVACYGYLDPTATPHTWSAHYFIQKPRDLITLLQPFV